MIRMLRIRRERSGSVARRRLKILLAADKTGCSPELLEMLKSDLCRGLPVYGSGLRPYGSAGGADAASGIRPGHAGALREHTDSKTDLQ